MRSRSSSAIEPTSDADYLQSVLDEIERLAVPEGERLDPRQTKQDEIFGVTHLASEVDATVAQPPRHRLKPSLDPITRIDPGPAGWASWLQLTNDRQPYVGQTPAELAELPGQTVQLGIAQDLRVHEQSERRLIFTHQGVEIGSIRARIVDMQPPPGFPSRRYTDLVAKRNRTQAETLELVSLERFVHELQIVGETGPEEIRPQMWTAMVQLSEQMGLEGRLFDVQGMPVSQKFRDAALDHARLIEPVEVVAGRRQSRRRSLFEAAKNWVGTRPELTGPLPETEIIALDDHDEDSMKMVEGTTKVHVTTHAKWVAASAKGEYPGLNVFIPKKDFVQQVGWLADRVEEGYRPGGVNISYGFNIEDGRCPSLASANRWLRDYHRRQNWSPPPLVTRSNFLEMRPHILAAFRAEMSPDDPIVKTIDNIERLTAAGIRVAVAAGNSGDGTFNILSLARGVVIVGALGPDGKPLPDSGNLVHAWARGFAPNKWTGDGWSHYGDEISDMALQDTQFKPEKLPYDWEVHQAAVSMGTSYATPKFMAAWLRLLSTDPSYDPRTEIYDRNRKTWLYRNQNEFEFAPVG